VQKHVAQDESMNIPRGLTDVIRDIRTSVLFSTRLPLGRPAVAGGAASARATWAWPLAGALVGSIGAGVYWATAAAGVPTLAAAGLAVAATLLATGCLHEDGLADTADGFGGASSRERKLVIMSDSRIGAYGACVLIMSLLLRIATIASLGDPLLVVPVLIAANIAARSSMPVLMRLVPPARNDGLSAEGGRPPLPAVGVAVLLGTIALALGLGVMPGLIAFLLIACAVALMAWLCRQQIGGQTGDVLGALEQICEVLILLVASALV
jgi:adenosylcobinamide-GDP ribazoletransferase